MPEPGPWDFRECLNPECEEPLDDPAELAVQLATAALCGQLDAGGVMLAAAVSLRGYCSQECWIAVEPETWPDTPIPEDKPHADHD
jgi:hypothetical protein